MELAEKFTQWIRKYRFVALILLLGLALMLIPFGGKEDTEKIDQSAAPTQPDLSAELSAILSQIKGAGEVSVMLSLDTGIDTIYQSDESITNGDNSTSRNDTVIITDEDRAQTGLVQHIIYPKYRGAIIVCQGADDAAVRLSIAEAVSRITGLGMDKISVLKMK